MLCFLLVAFVFVVLTHILLGILHGDLVNFWGGGERGICSLVLLLHFVVSLSGSQKSFPQDVVFDYILTAIAFAGANG